MDRAAAVRSRPSTESPHVVDVPASRAHDRALATRLAHAVSFPVDVELWDGWRTARTDGVQTLATVTIKARAVLEELPARPSLTFGDAYARGDLSVSGDLVGLLESIHRAPLKTPLLGRVASWLSLALRAPNRLRRSTTSARFHYDLGNEFYARWLDESLAYTCAYYERPTDSLEQAQANKHDLVCRKLRLRPGMTVVEAGGGWGALALHMASRHDVRVKSYNVSAAQVEYARARARALGLADRVEFVLDDYRTLEGSYDAFVSVGMFEHVGRAHYDDFARVIRRAIGSRGVGLLHTEGRMAPIPCDEWFERRVFPGAYIPSLTEIVETLRVADVVVQDVENLGPHYERTLTEWRRRFDLGAPGLAATHGWPLVRAWSLYLASGVAAFRSLALQLFQVVFTGRSCAVFPETRADLYTPA